MAYGWCALRPAIQFYRPWLRRDLTGRRSLANRVADRQIIGDYQTIGENGIFLMTLQQVNIGHTSALDQWHGFACPAHLRFLEKPTRENALECAKALWELRDWLWRETYPGISMRDDQLKVHAFDQELLSACPELAWLRDIAESAKHGGQLNRATVEVDSIGGGGGLGGLHQEFGPLGMVEHKPECTLVIVFKDGRPDQSLPETLARVMTFWRGRLVP